MTQERDELGRILPGFKPPQSQLDAMAEGRKKGYKERKEETKARIIAEMKLDPESTVVQELLNDWLKTKKSTTWVQLTRLSPKFADLPPAAWDPESGEPCPVCGGAGASGDTMSKLCAEHPGLLDAILEYTDKGE